MDIASRRQNMDHVAAARITAMGVAAGFTGKMKAIDQLARRMRMPSGSTTHQSIQDRLQRAFGHFINEAGARG